jgi:hypothetical protein
VTAVTKQMKYLEKQLRRLLALTELHALQWINLDHSNIHFITLTK